MSWCGGGEIKPTPGVEYRVLAIHGYTLCPGSWPPSPGLAPCAILICRSSALTRYSLVTPNRPLATCLTAERRRSPLASGMNRSGSSPPSPVFDRPPSRFIALARVWWALGGDGAAAHAAGENPPHDAGRRFHIIDPNGRGFLGSFRRSAIQGGRP